MQKISKPFVKINTKMFDDILVTVELQDDIEVDPDKFNFC